MFTIPMGFFDQPTAGSGGGGTTNEYKFYWNQDQNSTYAQFFELDVINSNNTDVLDSNEVTISGSYNVFPSDGGDPEAIVTDDTTDANPKVRWTQSNSPGDLIMTVTLGNETLQYLDMYWRQPKMCPGYYVELNGDTSTRLYVSAGGNQNTPEPYLIRIQADLSSYEANP